MSPFISSMPAEGLIEIPPKSKQTPLPTTAIGFVRFDRAPFHRIATRRLSRADPRPDREQRVHPQFAHRLLVERLHVDAELLQRFGAIGELDGKEDVRRLVDQIAGQFDAVSDGEALLSGRARGGGVARADDEIGRLDAIVLRVPSCASCICRTGSRAGEGRAQNRRPPSRPTFPTAPRRRLRPASRRSLCRR